MALEMKNLLLKSDAYFLSKKKMFDKNPALECTSKETRRIKQRNFFTTTELAGKSFPRARLRPGMR